MIGLFQEMGPCHVNADSNSTYINDWAWNKYANMIYIDQPVQTGFSYDELANGTVTNSQSLGSVVDYSSEHVDNVSNNATSYIGTFPSGIQNATANSTTIAAHAAWHFAQTFFTEFPAYKPNNDKISIWTESVR